MMGQTFRAHALARAAALAVCAAIPAFAPAAALAQAAMPTTDRLRIGGDVASSWADGATRVVLVDRDVTIRSDDATLTADRAVVWLTPTPTGFDARVALFGHARAVRGDLTRAGDELYVTLATRPDVRLDVRDLAQADRRTDVRYLAAAQLRRQAERGEVPSPIDVTPAVSMPATTEPFATAAPPTTGATTGPTGGLPRALPPSRRGTFSYRSARADVTTTPDGRVAIVMNGDVQVIEQKSDGSRIEMQAQSVVLFTRWTEARQMLQGGLTAADVDAAYLEDDIRITSTSGDAKRPEQTLRATRAVYEFAGDRAILTDAVLHSYTPGADAPLVLRAREMRKLGADAYLADHSTITTSNFKVPSLAISSTKVTVRQADAGDGTTTTSFVADNVTPRVFGVPVFYFPKLFGTVSNGTIPLRQIQLSNSSGFGTGVATEWGLFDTLGTPPPPGVDASYRADYYTERGPAGGVDTTYAGGSINEATLQPFSFEGAFTAYGTLDHGMDKLGRGRGKPAFDSDFRGRVRWDHQQFLSDGWQVQAQAAYVSDPTFLEEWFRNEFRNGLEQDSTLLVRRSSGTEVFSVLLDANLSGIPTVADQLQEITVSNGGNRYPITVERLPEVQYHRLGDSFADDRLTLVSNNSVGALHFKRSYASLNATDGGFAFRNTRSTANVDERFTGLPSYGYTGYTNDYVARGDFRQEVALPLGDDRVRLTPYGVVRYTAYSDSPDDDAQQRLLGGVGVRTSAQFTRTYDGVQSKLFDLNRVRHVVEPQLSLFASGQTQDRNDLYVYDEGVDGISDVVGGQFVVRQRFQTKRGGEGLYRSVDFLTLNAGVNAFGNQEREIRSPVGADDLVTANSFRGLYYDSEPEASTARSTAFADSAWRLTDTTAILVDGAWNLDAQDLATTAIGLAVDRDPRTRYFAGLRYIGELNSTIASFNFDYTISERYSIAFNQSFNLSEGQNQSTSAELVRRFEQFIFRVTVYFDRIEDEGGVQFTVSPRDLPFGGGPVGVGNAGGRS